MPYPHIESGKKASIAGLSYGILALGFMLLRQIGGEQFDHVMRSGLIGSTMVYIPAFIFQIGRSIKQKINFEKKMQKF